jgi:DNA-binding NtrC family response regulator
LNTIEIPLPALAARPADILPLAQHFLGADLSLSDEARQALLQHSWPGNVRELRNVVERARLLVSGRQVQAGDLNLPAPKGQGPNEEDGLSRVAIEASLRAAGGNVSRAAASLGLSRQALYRRMERLGMRS